MPSAPPRKDPRLKVRTLGHATLLLEEDGVPVLATDPWILGSAHWRSWWSDQYTTEADVERIRAARIYCITHHRPARFHWPSLRKLGPHETLHPTLGDIDRIGHYWKPWIIRHKAVLAIKSLRLSRNAFGARLDRRVSQMSQSYLGMFDYPRLLRTRLGPSDARFHYIQHHLCHQEFGKLAGLPSLLNTSFKLQEPIACTPEAAIRAFRNATFDAMVIESFLMLRGQKMASSTIPETSGSGPTQ